MKTTSILSLSLAASASAFAPAPFSNRVSSKFVLHETKADTAPEAPPAVDVTDNVADSEVEAFLAMAKENAGAEEADVTDATVTDADATKTDVEALTEASEENPEPEAAPDVVEAPEVKSPESEAAAVSTLGITAASGFVDVSGYETKADLEVLATELNPVVGFYDPLNLAEAEFWGCTQEETIGFLRHAEIKHGRVAMFAFVGYIVHANGIRWPWPMMLDGTPFPTGQNPPELWDQIPDNAKWQIFSLIGFLEFWSELSTPDNIHYMKGGKPGAYPDFTWGGDGIPHPVPFNFYDPFKLSKNKSEEKKARGLVVEINNGRLAMLGIISFLSAQTIPGSVPLITGIVQPYSGQVMAPFTANILGMPFGMN